MEAPTSARNTKGTPHDSLSRHEADGMDGTGGQTVALKPKKREKVNLGGRSETKEFSLISAVYARRKRKTRRRDSIVLCTQQTPETSVKKRIAPLPPTGGLSSSRFSAKNLRKEKEGRRTFRSKKSP